jgi:hypothetical protein
VFCFSPGYLSESIRQSEGRSSHAFCIDSNVPATVIQSVCTKSCATSNNNNRVTELCAGQTLGSAQRYAPTKKGTVDLIYSSRLFVPSCHDREGGFASRHQGESAKPMRHPFLLDVPFLYPSLLKPLSILLILVLNVPCCCGCAEWRRVAVGGRGRGAENENLIVSYLRRLALAMREWRRKRGKKGGVGWVQSRRRALHDR